MRWQKEGGGDDKMLAFRAKEISGGDESRHRLAFVAREGGSKKCTHVLLFEVRVGGKCGSRKP